MSQIPGAALELEGRQMKEELKVKHLWLFLILYWMLLKDELWEIPTEAPQAVEESKWMLSLLSVKQRM